MVSAVARGEQAGGVHHSGGEVESRVEVNGSGGGFETGRFITEEVGGKVVVHGDDLGGEAGVDGGDRGGVEGVNLGAESL